MEERGWLLDIAAPILAKIDLCSQVENTNFEAAYAVTLALGTQQLPCWGHPGEYKGA